MFGAFGGFAMFGCLWVLGCLGYLGLRLRDQGVKVKGIVRSSGMVVLASSEWK